MRANVYLVLNRLLNRVLSPAPLLHASRAGPLASPPHQPIARAGRARKPIAGSAGQAAVSVLNRILITAGQSLLGIKAPIQPRIEHRPPGTRLAPPCYTPRVQGHSRTARINQ